MQDFRTLRVWQQSHQLALRIYRVTAAFPPAERFGLVSQMRRASVSITSNIAEGCGRGSAADTRRFMQMAIGSSCELLSQLMLARDLGLMTAEDFDGLERESFLVRRALIRFAACLH